MIDKNEQLTIDELLFAMKQKYKDLDISTRHLGRVIRANNRTRKRTRHQHYPKERRTQLTDKNKEMEAFYKYFSVFTKPTQKRNQNEKIQQYYFGNES